MHLSRIGAGCLVATVLCACWAPPPEELTSVVAVASSVPPPRLGMWVWDTTIAGDDEATDDLLAFANKQRVTTLFVACDPVGYGQVGAESRYELLVDAAHAAGLEVYATSGYGWFTVPCGAGLAGQKSCFKEGWGIYEACATSSVGFDAIMDNSEPYAAHPESWEANFEQRAAWHLEYLRGIRARIGDLPLHHTVPFWYDTLKPLDLGRGSELKTLDQWVLDVVDGMGVMAYRDDAREILHVARGELLAGPVWIGLETIGSTDDANVTFHDDGRKALLTTLEALGVATRGHPHLVGFMIHHYGAWQDL